MKTDVERWPNGNAFVEGFKDAKVTDVFYVVDGMRKGIEEIVRFPFSELGHLIHGEETAIGHAISVLDRFVASEVGLYKNDLPTVTEQTGRKVVEYLKDDGQRALRGQKPKLVQALEDDINQIGSLPKEDRLRAVGKEAIYLALPPAAQAAGRAVKPALEAGYSAVKRVAAEIAADYELRAPVTIAFDYGRLNSGVPIDYIKLQNPISKKKGSSVPKAASIKGRLKEAKLPIEGKIRFVPHPEYHPSIPLPRGPNNGFVDRFGNEWIKGPSRTSGEPFE